MDLFTQFESLCLVLVTRPLGHGTAQTRRDQCPLTRMHNTWTVGRGMQRNVCRGACQLHATLRGLLE